MINVQLSTPPKDLSKWKFFLSGVQDGLETVWVPTVSEEGLLLFEELNPTEEEAVTADVKSVLVS